MRREIVARLHCIMRGGTLPNSGVTGVSGVTGSLGLRLKPPELRQLRQLRLEDDGGGSSANKGVSGHVTAPTTVDWDAIEERAGLAADSVPACYLDAWARLNCQKPMSVSEAEWRLALDDGGLFLDAWGPDAATMRWTAGELFDVPREGRPRGLVWQLKGERVEALGEDHARLSDGRMIEYQQIRRERK